MMFFYRNSFAYPRTQALVAVGRLHWFAAGFTYAQRLWITRLVLVIFIMRVLYSKLRFCEGNPRKKG